ncbi:carboxymuconolactone decarboxylase [Ectothiorhodospira haloalkaliphila]|uniref:Carboxymuconolactone decarboxylase n=1 Tax=Ectothiorhodospira haloalkaliphila TaxID=421628 RepID=W8L2P4_9GAMM|nr:MULTISPECIES: carboxymuconolactone decarboxylase family protein [Ectothiorhodospira]AHK78190.1 carboxymuconolactone decarboxylase [Ectothiorhodospira haloalkaliphila]MCG5495495.1 carboxymuconolactone decarboxylase family protein [Ectothiorhodospira variabilis]MCG5499117.1 carboxymuconolactone decarboxylase family protein [Ectothiorhodospira variabilis]MCG5503896.1 carboxymuconolactone decarboxylase family protein [Ectothiorhodospira variabilis]MCG5506973.1 carboxymuconolactone decarboxylase
MNQERFPLHDDAQVPEPAREMSMSKFGMIPNLIRSMSTSPQLAEAYLTLNNLFEQTSLTAIDRHVVLLSISTRHQCHYCVAAHSITADMAEVPAEITDALRARQALDDPRLEALRQFTLAVVEQRGWVSDEQVEDFLETGFTHQQVLEVILGVGLKTLSNYTNHVTATTLDAPFAGRRWEPSVSG